MTAHAHAVSAIAEAVAAGLDGLEHVTFWTEDGVDAPGHLIQLIADQRNVVGATIGMVPVPGMAPPPAMPPAFPASSPAHGSCIRPGQQWSRGPGPAAGMTRLGNGG